MNSFSNWLNAHKYELLNHLNGNEICEIGDIENNSKKLLKILNLSELDPQVVVEVVNTMNQINQMSINGLMKYKIIENSENTLYRIMEEHKTHLDEINPIKYFENTGLFDVLNGILLVLKSLNEIGFIHSDLKPSNIFLNDESEVIINDYLNNLLYKGREDMKIDGKRKDLCFVCIDELLGKELDICSDIWNFGLIFYYLKSGKYPFVGSNISETMLNILNINFIPLKSEYSIELNSFLSKILCKEKNDRLKLNEIFIELKKLNEPEIPVLPVIIEEINQAKLPVIPSEEEEMKVSEEVKKNIHLNIEHYKREKDSMFFIRDIGLKDSGMEYLASTLRRMFNVTYVDISLNGLTSIGLNKFIECLKFFPNMDHLGLNDNPIGNNSLKIFSENLYLIHKLKNLHLENCGLGENDMKYLSSHFKDIHHLEILNVSSDNGVKYLCENIKEIRKLIGLGLYECEISDIGGEILINNLKVCKKLVELCTEKNKISNYDDFKRKMLRHPNKNLKVDPGLGK